MLIYWVRGWELLLENYTGQGKGDRRCGRGEEKGAVGMGVPCCAWCSGLFGSSAQLSAVTVARCASV